MGITQISDPQEWQSKVIESSVPVFVDFWAEWCGPCKQIGPILEEIAVEHESKIKVLKINIDQNPQKPQKYLETGIPTFSTIRRDSDSEVVVIINSQFFITVRRVQERFLQPGLIMFSIK